MLKYVKIGLLSIFFHLSGFAGNAMIGESGKLYVQNFKNDAIKEMLQYNIPASIILAQGMLESAYGTSDLAIYANNHFGIKCHEEWEGPTFIKTDDAKDECFRKYPTVLDSYTDHSLFLKSRARYASLFELNHTDYKGWAKGLKDAGYATDPKYVERLLELIEGYELFKYDLSNQQTEKVKPEGSKKQSRRAKKEVVKKESVPKESIRQKPPLIENKSETVLENEGSREVLRLGVLKYVIIKPGDTFSKIAEETDKDLWQLYKFNDMTAEDNLVSGHRLYLQPKNRKAKEPFHIVQKGETMKSISQLYGIKLKLLYRKNKMRDWEEPITGQELYLRHKKK